MNQHVLSLPDQFMNWLPVWSDEKQKWEKYPCLPDGTIVNAHDPSNWVPYSVAKSAGKDVAFVITENDPYFFLDLDDCADVNGNWSPMAQAIYLSFSGAMGEVSYSGKGLHVIGKCQPDALQDRKNKWDGWLEFYTHGRFIALGQTGLHTIGGGDFKPDVDWTSHILTVVPQRTVLGELPQGVDPAYTGPEDDEVLMAKMLASTGGAAAAFGGRATVAQLWNADTEALSNIWPDGKGSYDRSSADAALMAHLAFWTGKDMPRMDRLFRRSALMRPKYDVAHRHDGATYGHMTLEGAARMCNRVYDVAPKAERATSTPAPEVYLTIAEMIEHFEGCIYILDIHKVLTPEGDLLDPQQFKAFYGGHIFQMNPDGTQPEKNAFVAFTENRTHRFPKARKAVFNPTREPGSIVDDEVNTYFPQHVDIHPGDISKFHDIFCKLLPDPNDRAILLAWMASCVQNPHRKFQWAPVLQGAEGNGKTFLMNCVAYAIGEHFTHRPNPREINEKYNDWMEHSLFVLVEEIHMEGRRDTLDGLKTKITNEMLPYRGMGVSERTGHNYSKFAFCTNYMEAVIKNRSDRRYAIFYTAQQSYEDIMACGMGGSYFPDLYRWAREGGYAAVGHFLTHYDIPDQLDPAKLCHRAPRTSSTDKAVVKSLGPVETEILEATEDGTVGFRGGFISSIKLDDLIRRRQLRVSRNKRADILETLGYVKCPVLADGRAPTPLVWEDNKRPVIFVRVGMALEDDVMAMYRKAQGYDPV